MSNEDFIQDAINDEKNIFFYYENARGEAGKFIIKPVTIKTTSGGSRIVRAFLVRSRVRRDPDLPPPQYPGRWPYDEPFLVSFTINRMDGLKYPTIWDYILFYIIW